MNIRAFAVVSVALLTGCASPNSGDWLGEAGKAQVDQSPPVRPESQFDPSPQQVDQFPPVRPNQQVESQSVSSPPVGFKVENLIVKRVTVSGLFGKGARFRYFFAVKNTGTLPFYDAVEITLLNKLPGVINAAERFQCSIQPGQQQVVYIDAHTGPERFHADAFVAKFSYAATSIGVAGGRGEITTKFEDLTR